MTRIALSASALAALALPCSPAPSDSVSQVSTATQDSLGPRKRRQKQKQSQVYDDDDLTDPLASEDENTLRRTRRDWFSTCYKSFEKAKIQRDADSMVVKTKADDGQVFINYIFKCKICGKTVSRHCGSNTTSNLVKHVKLCNTKDGIWPQQQLLANFASGSTYRRERLRTLILRWVTGCHRPMAIVGDTNFLNIIKMLNPQAVVPSRNTVTSDIKTMFSMTKANLTDILRSLLQAATASSSVRNRVLYIARRRDSRPVVAASSDRSTCAEQGDSVNPCPVAAASGDRFLVCTEQSALRNHRAASRSLPSSYPVPNIIDTRCCREAATASPVCAEQIDLAWRRELCRRTPVVTASSDRLSPVRNRVNLGPVRSADAHFLSPTHRPTPVITVRVLWITFDPCDLLSSDDTRTPGLGDRPKPVPGIGIKTLANPPMADTPQTQPLIGLPPPRPPRSPKRPVDPRIASPPRNPPETTKVEDDFDFEAFYNRYCDENGLARAEMPYEPDEVNPTTAHPTPGSAQTAAASTTTLADDEEDWALFAPRVTSVPTPLVTPAAQRVEKRMHDDVSDTEETRPVKYPRLKAHPEPPRAKPQLGRRSVPLPRKFVCRQRRASSAPTTGIPPFFVQYSPPPRRPPSPDDPVHAPPLVDPDPRSLAPDCTVVEGDNTLTGGVKTLDVSDFDSVLAQNTVDSLPQTPPRTHLFPCHAFERPRDPDELATRTLDRRSRSNVRSPYPTTPRNHARRAQNATNRRPEDVPPTSVVSRHMRKRRRANAAAAPPHSPGVATNAQTVDHRTRRRTTDLRSNSLDGTPAEPDSHAKPQQARPHRTPERKHIRAETTEATPAINRANAAVEMFLRRYDAARPTPAPAAAPASHKYDAIAQHLTYRLATDPDTTRVTQPFTLQDKPRAIRLQWKKR
ncbi:hypothetical protein EDB89DRAFT_2070200 [Lactarius sanguifluus]|nr:hypothetical protein EDB89DRAFT_2070200 [Lactarius sanguifluus]